VKVLFTFEAPAIFVGKSFSKVNQVLFLLTKMI